MARRATRALPIAPVTWRDGVHLTGTPIWCDARRRRDICFVSAADAGVIGARHGHGQLIATPLTLALLGAQAGGHLGVPVRQRFTLGTVRLELIPSGHGLGAAALFADVAGRKVLYANAVRTVAGGACDAAEVRACDAVVVDAPFGEDHHRFPPLARVVDEVRAWTAARLADGRVPVLFVDSALDGLEVATLVGGPLAGARAIRIAAGRAERPVIGGITREMRPVVWLDADHAGLAKAIARRRFATALVSGRAVAGAGAGYDAAFAWATAADRPQLLGWIEATKAREVFVTGAYAETIAAAVGPRARVIGPPQQMALFG